jgi:hypothetical protein
MVGETHLEERRRNDLRVALLEERMASMLAFAKEHKSHCDDYQRETDKTMDIFLSQLNRIENKIDGMNKFAAGMIAVATGFIALFSQLSDYFTK